MWIFSVLMLSFFKRLATNWHRHATMDSAAGLTFYTLLAFAPMVLLLLFIAKAVAIGGQNPERIAMSIATYFPPESEAFVTQFTLGSLGSGSFFNIVLSLIIILWSASAVTAALERSVHRIFEYTHSGRQGLLGIVQGRGLAILALLGFLISLLLSLIIPSAVRWFLPGIPIQLLESGLSLGLFALFLAGLLRLFLGREFPKRTLLLGGWFLAGLVLLGRILLTWIFSIMNFASDVAVGGAIILFLFWVYATWLILLAGMECLALLHRQYGVRSSLAFQRSNGVDAPEMG